MANYAYTGVDNNTGKQVRGTVVADTVEDALEKVKERDVTPISCDVATAATREVSITKGGKKPTHRDMSVFCRQMVSVLEAGISMSKALEMLGAQTENRILSEAIWGCKTKIESGAAMSEAMKDYKIFPEIFCTMVAAGEESGSLEVSFSRMAVKFEKDAQIKALVRKSSMYPMMLAFVLVGVVIAMLGFVVPKFEDFLGSLGSELPAMTRGLVSASDFVKNNIVLIILGIIGLVIGFRKFKQTSVGRHFVDNIMLRIPAFSNLVTKTACSNLMRTLATLLATGIPMLEALDTVASTMTNIFFQEGLQRVKADVATGVPLSDALEATGLFPPMVYQMSRIGEETGSLVPMFDKTADYYDEEVKAATESVTALIEPMVIIAMAGIVGYMVIALLSPMMGMYDSLDQI